MYFIAFEGLDGSGKSSLMHQLDRELKTRQFQTCLTREPGGTELGDELRNLILRKSGQAPGPRTELLMYEASRAQHVDLVIQPALAEKKWVLCDRFTASSVAFQGGGRAITLEQVNWLNDFAVGKCKPHLNVLLDLSVEESKVRRGQRQSTTGIEDDRMECEADDFHQRVRQGFLNQAKFNPSEWLVLSSLDTPETLLKQLLSELRKRQWLSS